jgi:hypothetical protein
MLTCGKADNLLNYDQPDAAFRESLTYAKWFKAATEAGLRVIIEYPFQPMLDSVNDNNGSVTMRYLNYLLSGGKQPVQGGGLMLVLEENTWLEGFDKHTVVCTSTNYSTDLRSVYNQIWTKFKLVPGIRTGRWFLDKTDLSGRSIYSQVEWLDKGQDTIPFSLARYRLSQAQVEGDFHDAIVSVPDPSVTNITVGGITKNEQSHYLYFGNNTRWMGYDVGTVRHKAVIDKSGAQAIFRLTIWHDTPEKFDEYFNFPVTVDPPVDPPIEPPVTPPSDIEARLKKVEQFIQDLKTLLSNYK